MESVNAAHQPKGKYFYVYDINLYRLLEKNGFVPLTKARHWKTLMVFTMFERTPELDKIVREHTNAVQAAKNQEVV